MGWVGSYVVWIRIGELSELQNWVELFLRCHLERAELFLHCHLERAEPGERSLGAVTGAGEGLVFHFAETSPPLRVVEVTGGFPTQAKTRTPPMRILHYISAFECDESNA